MAHYGHISHMSGCEKTSFWGWFLQWGNGGLARRTATLRPNVHNDLTGRGVGDQTVISPGGRRCRHGARMASANRRCCSFFYWNATKILAVITERSNCRLVLDWFHQFV